MSLPVKAGIVAVVAEPGLIDEMVKLPIEIWPVEAVKERVPKEAVEKATLSEVLTAWFIG